MNKYEQFYIYLWRVFGSLPYFDKHPDALTNEGKKIIIKDKLFDEYAKLIDKYNIYNLDIEIESSVGRKYFSPYSEYLISDNDIIIKYNDRFLLKSIKNNKEYKVLIPKSQFYKNKIKIYLNRYYEQLYRTWSQALLGDKLILILYNARK